MKVTSPRKGTELTPRVFASWQEQVNRAIRNLGFVRAISFSVAHNFPSVPAHSELLQLFTVTGARVGACVVVSLAASPFLEGIIFDAKVTQDDQIRIRASNYSDAAIDPANKNFAVVVFNL